MSLLVAQGALAGIQGHIASCCQSRPRGLFHMVGSTLACGLCRNDAFCHIRFPMQARLVTEAAWEGNTSPL